MSELFSAVAQALALVHVYFCIIYEIVIFTCKVPAFSALIFAFSALICLQCFDAVGWAAGRASGL